MSIYYNKEFLFKVDPILTLEQDNCVSTLITIGDYNLLFDCGWNEKFSPNIKEIYQKRLANIKLDIIILSNNYISYFGALPLIKSFPNNLNTKVYSTIPIANLGVYVMSDAYISNLESKENSLAHFQITQEFLSKVFYDIKKVKYYEPIFLEDLALHALPSGTSIGGSAWSCSYKFFSFIYASEFSIEPKIVADSFPYKKLKRINYFITDNNYRDDLTLARREINENLEKMLKLSLENQKNIFVPIDNVNSLLEMVTRLEKILDQIKVMNIGKLDKFEYKILVCSFCSSEIVEGIKSLTEFLGRKISQQFCSGGDKPFNFEDVICVKNIDEYKTQLNQLIKTNKKYIILSTSETLDIGLSYSILPTLLNDSNLIVINIFKDFAKNSYFGEIIKRVKEYKINKIKYFKKIVKERIKKEKKEEKIEIKDNKKNGAIDLNENKNKAKKNIINNSSSYQMITNKSKLFQETKNGYLSFNFEPTNKYTDYGIELNPEEIEIMKKSNESENINNIVVKSEFMDKKETNFELAEFDIPTKIEQYETTIDIKCEFFFYPIINIIDYLSKKIILEEINPKDGIILIGKPNALKENVNYKNIKCITNNICFEEKIAKKILEFNYTSEDLYGAKKIPIEQADENLYSFDSILLSVKTIRKKLIDVSIMNNKHKKLNNDKIEVIKNKESENDKMFSKNNLRLINIKQKLEKELNIKLQIFEQKIRTLDRTVELFIKDGEIVLEGEFNEQYFNIQSQIKKIYFNYNEK